jgi:hypothetical protein
MYKNLKIENEDFKEKIEPPMFHPSPPNPKKKKKTRKIKPTKEANCLPRQQLHSGNQQAAIKEWMLNTFPELEPLRHSNNIHK